MIVTHFPYGPTAYFGIMKAALRHDITRHKTEDDTYSLSTVSQVYPHLIFDNFGSRLGGRVCLFFFPLFFVWM